MKLRVCRLHAPACYTLKVLCPLCSQPTHDAHYKFIKLPNAPKQKNAQEFLRKHSN